LPGADAHLVPLSALTLDDDGRLGVRAAAPEPDGGARVAFHPVAIVRESPQGAWVAGLPERLEIIVVGQDFVSAGQRVHVARRETAQP
jgi:membrane fusion protein, multidrug efflux system